MTLITREQYGSLPILVDYTGSWPGRNYVGTAIAGRTLRVRVPRRVAGAVSRRMIAGGFPWKPPTYPAGEAAR